MGGTPLPPFTDKIFGKKGVTDLGGTPPSPFTDKIRKVVFEVFPYKLGIYMYVSNFKFFSSHQNILQEILNKRDSLNKSKFFPNMYNLVAMDI